MRAAGGGHLFLGGHRQDYVDEAGAYLWHAMIHIPFIVLCGGGRDAAKVAVEPQPSHRDESRDCVFGRGEQFPCTEALHLPPRNGVTIADAINLSPLI